MKACDAYAHMRACVYAHARARMRIYRGIVLPILQPLC